MEMPFESIDIYDNLVGPELRFQFGYHIRRGMTPQELTDWFLELFEVSKMTPYEIAYFWFALADTQWKFGVLLDSVKQEALTYIEKVYDMENVKNDNARKRKKRLKVMGELKEKLLTPPPKKVIKQITEPQKRRLYYYPWKKGDVFAYKMESELATEKGLFNKYLLIQKVDEHTWYPGHMIPIVYAKLSDDIPQSQDDIQKAEYIQISFIKYEERFFPIDFQRYEEDLAEKQKLNFETDEFGLLPEFRIGLITKSAKNIPENLIYIGNFPDIIPPQKEFVPYEKLNNTHVLWKNFETVLIECYYGHNLRNLKIYAE